MSFDWKATSVVNELSKAELNAGKTTYKVRNVWTRKDASTTKKAFSGTVPAHDVTLLVLGK